MMQPVLSDQIAQAQYRERLSAAAQERLVASVRAPNSGIAHRGAVVLGHALLRLGVGLLRYGRAELPATMPVYRPSAKAIRLN